MIIIIIIIIIIMIIIIIINSTHIFAELLKFLISFK